MTTRREPPNHNTLTCYVDYRCRLPECVKRYNARNLERLHAHKNGTWGALVDAGPVRDHIIKLGEDDITPADIATSTGIPIQTILEFLHSRRSRARGRKQRTSPETAKKILAVSSDNYVARRVPAIGTARRLQALAGLGWPMQATAQHAGISRHNVSDYSRQDVVFASTAAKVAKAFDELQHLKPERHGVDKGQAKRARNWAARKNWPTVAYWAERMDVIDDPDFEPLYGVTRREIVAQDANWLMRTNGLDRATAAARLGISKAYIDHAFRDHPQYALDVAA